jgi:hypothetical protein
MKFSDLPSNPTHFVVITQNGSSKLLVKDGHGQIRSASDYKPLQDHKVMPNTEVQQVSLK